MPLPREEFDLALQQDRYSWRELDRLDAEESLLDFIRLTWHALEPEGRPFVSGWAIEAVCDHLQAVTDGHIKNLLINVPPGFMKSLGTNVFWPAWEWGPRSMPWRRYVSFSYAGSLTIRDNRKCRNLMKHRLYQDLWGDRFTFSGDQDAKVKFENTATGFKLASSVGGTGTGERGDVLVVDDPNNVKESESDAKLDEAQFWFSEVLPSRVNDPELTATIVIQQRTNGRDVSGLILEHAKAMGFEWLCIMQEYEPKFPCYTSIPPRNREAEPVRVTLVHEEDEPIPHWQEDPAGETRYCHDPRTEPGELAFPERYSRTYIEETLKPRLRAWGGDYAVTTQFQMQPSSRHGGMFQRGDWQYVDAAPQTGRACRGWDLAGTDDGGSPYTVGTRWRLAANGRLYLEDVERFQVEAGDVEREIVRVASADGPSVEIDIPQDPGAGGKAWKSYLVRQLHGYTVHFSPETGSKRDRAKPLASQARARNIYIVRAPWNRAFTGEAEGFPTGKFKDQIDASSRSYARLLKLPVDVGTGAGTLYEG